jgi:hypothetical protein
MTDKNKSGLNTQIIYVFLQGFGGQDIKETLINGYEVYFGNDGLFWNHTVIIVA